MATAEAALGTEAEAEAAGMVARMTPAQRAEALQEAQRLLSPEAMAMLRARTQARHRAAAPAEDVGNTSQPEGTPSQPEASPVTGDGERKAGLVTAEGELLTPEEAARLLPFEVDPRWLNMNIVRIGAGLLSGEKEGVWGLKVFDLVAATE
jgi:hypothetical protein